ncbi:MAG: hypothetical protein VKO39_12430 [Cyanobacteriota bacterium]|nr:hypothetical protein [Cyanobacteriota bacterium]
MIYDLNHPSPPRAELDALEPDPKLARAAERRETELLHQECMRLRRELAMEQAKRELEREHWEGEVARLSELLEQPSVRQEEPQAAATGLASAVEWQALELELRRQKERAELLQRQVQELQDQLEHNFRRRQDAAADPAEAPLPPPVPPAPCPPPAAAKINSQRDRLLSPP